MPDSGLLPGRATARRGLRQDLATQKHGRGPAARIHLLAGVGAATDGGEPLDVGPAKCQAVFAALALSAGTAVPASRRVDLVWGEDPPRTAERTLQSYLTRLRKGRPRLDHPDRRRLPPGRDTRLG